MGSAVAEPPTKGAADGNDFDDDTPDRVTPDPEPKGVVSAEGTVDVGKLKAGGKSPTHGTLKFEGLKEITLPDKMGYQKGNVVYITGLATVVQVGERDKRDGVTKQVVDCKQQHVAAFDDFRVVNEPCVQISRVEAALSEIAELAATGEADIPGAIEAAIDKLASFSS